MTWVKHCGEPSNVIQGTPLSKMTVSYYLSWFFLLNEMSKSSHLKSGEVSISFSRTAFLITFFTYVRFFPLSKILLKCPFFYGA